MKILAFTLLFLASFFSANAQIASADTSSDIKGIKVAYHTSNNNEDFDNGVTIITEKKDTKKVYFALKRIVRFDRKSKKFLKKQEINQALKEEF